MVKNYLDYWDRVINQWFMGSIEEKQKCFLSQEWLNLTPMHMPEPYWGDPENCSIVIANYNPGGGADRNRHTFRDCHCCPESFINQVQRKGCYSEVAKSFPIIDDPENKSTGIQPCWWREYGGRKWWLNKLPWIKTAYAKIMNVPFEENAENPFAPLDKKPFAIEFCGWHSTKWPPHSLKKFYFETKCRNNSPTSLSPIIDKYFIEPLVYSIKNSTCNCGICVGSQFHELFQEMEKQNKGVHLIKDNKYANCNCVYYDVYGEHVIVIWGTGRNRYPNLNNVIL